MDAEKIAKKKYGQNFLQDSNIITKIIESIPKNDHELIEIGAGLGDLTHKLLEVKKVKAYEVDDDLSIYLKKRFSKELEDKKFVLIPQDVLKAWQGKSLQDSDYDLVANLPYYIATAIILRALKDKSCKNMIVMIQKEVAQKFVAISKQKEFCALSVIAQSIAEVSILFDVPPNAFKPMPKVVSSVIKFEKFHESEQGFCVSDKFEKFLRACFMQPRKILIKNLSQIRDKQSLKEIFLKLSISLNIRPHEVDIKTYHHLFDNITKVKDDRAKQKKQ